MIRTFNILGIVGASIIFILSFIVPTNPFEIIKCAINDYPAFMIYGIGGGALYLLILYGIYNLIEKIKDFVYNRKLNYEKAKN